jgi:RNA recognition motif-containing protein
VTTKLHVGNLPASVTETDLRTLFAEAGEVTSVALIMDRDTGRPRGFGFVEMADAAMAEKAIRMVSGKTLGDRRLAVNPAKPQTTPYESGGGGGYRRDRS